MPKVKKHYKKKKAQTKTRNKNKNKNKNIIKINVSNQSGGGSSTIPIPYSISSQMFPTSQPLNIYNTMSRNPYDTEYKEPVVNRDLNNEPKPVIETIPINEPKFTPLSNNNLQFENPLIPDNYKSLKSQIDKSKVLDELKNQQNESELEKPEQNTGGRVIPADYKTFDFNPEIIDRFKRTLDNELNSDGTPLTNKQKASKLRYFKRALVKSYNEKVP